MAPIVGLVFVEEFVSAEEEARLTGEIERIPFSEVRMHGVVAKRRIAHYGYHYSFDSRALSPGPEIPDWLLPLRERAAALAGVAPDEFAEALVTEYPAGAGIGWHRDAPPFGIVAGISLGAACRMRFRRGPVGNRETIPVELPPRSAYLLTGPARTQWEHTIPAVSALRYSITYRTLRRHPAQ